MKIIISKKFGWNVIKIPNSRKLYLNDKEVSEFFEPKNMKVIRDLVSKKDFNKSGITVNICSLLSLAKKHPERVNEVKNKRKKLRERKKLQNIEYKKFKTELSKDRI